MIFRRKKKQNRVSIWQLIRSKIKKKIIAILNWAAILIFWLGNMDLIFIWH
jgi:hypothetical protein